MFYNSDNYSTVSFSCLKTLVFGPLQASQSNDPQYPTTTKAIKHHESVSTLFFFVFSSSSSLLPFFSYVFLSSSYEIFLCLLDLSISSYVSSLQVHFDLVWKSKKGTGKLNLNYLLPSKFTQATFIIPLYSLRSKTICGKTHTESVGVPGLG